MSSSSTSSSIRSESMKPISEAASTIQPDLAESEASEPSETTSCITLPTQTSHTGSTKRSAPSSDTDSTNSTISRLSNQARYQRHILSLTNALRASHSAPAVTLNPLLNEVARLHNLDVARNVGELSHVSSDGRTLTERLLEQGYDFRYASENLARGQRDCKWVMNSWMKSPGHRRNVLNERVREMGLSVGVWKGRMYWCQVFGVRRR